MATTEPMSLSKVSPWPVTAKVQMWVGTASTVLASAGLFAVVHSPLAILEGLALTAVAVVPHEYLHRTAGRALGLKSEISWRAGQPHNQSLGRVTFRQLAMTSLAPQMLTIALAIGAVVTRSPVLFTATVGHLLISSGDVAHAVTAIRMTRDPKTKNLVLVNGAGPDAGLYRQVRQVERVQIVQQVVVRPTPQRQPVRHAQARRRELPSHRTNDRSYGMER